MPLSIAHIDASGNMKRSCDGCVFIETEPFGKDRTAYRCMSIRQGHYGRVVTTQLRGREPMLYRPAWCHVENTMTEKTKELGAILRNMNLPAGTVKTCAAQLFDIVKNDDSLVDIVLEDLKANKDAVKECEKKIASYARENRGGVDDYNAEVIIRKHFGLPEAGAEQDPFGETEETVGNVRKPEETKETEETAFDLSAFL